MTTTNETSLLWQLRRLMPRRRLSFAEALRITELQANRLLELAHIDEPGVPSELVTSLPYVQVIFRSDTPNDVSGGTFWLKPRWLVVLSALDSPARTRFSLFHEFKHIVDHGATPRLWREDPMALERLAHYFAACVLMPRRLVKRLWGEGVQQLDELAAIFGVSGQAMRYRLDQLGLAEPRLRCSREVTDSLASPSTHSLAA